MSLSKLRSMNFACFTPPHLQWTGLGTAQPDSREAAFLLLALRLVVTHICWLKALFSARNYASAGASPTENQTLADAEFEVQMQRTHARDDILQPIRG